jgi:glucose-specific phosphotransferase system IIA component
VGLLWRFFFGGNKMFRLFKKKDMNIYSPVNGKMVPLSEVPDKMFAEKVLGDGVAFYSDEDIIYSPCDGKVSMIADTGHAAGIMADNGAEILIHIGLDTVNLNGKGFEVLTKKDAKIKQGTPLIKVDRKFMSDNNINLIIPMIITNEVPFELQETDQVQSSSSVMTITG